MASIICGKRAWDLHKLGMKHLSDHSEDAGCWGSAIREGVTVQLQDLLALLSRIWRDDT